MKLLTFLMTVGEPTTYKALNLANNFLPEGKLVIYWNKSVAPEALNEGRLWNYSTHIITSMDNYGDMMNGFPVLYEDYDYILHLTGDTMLYTYSWDKYMEYITLDPMLGSIGSHTNTWKSGKKWKNKLTAFPDLAVLFSRKAVNAVGSYNVAFGAYGHAPLELQCRMRKAGFNIYTDSGLAWEAGGGHEGRSLFDPSEVKKLERQSKKVWDECVKKKLDYNWWDKDLGRYSKIKK